ncbi:type IV toxin-antitoxin system AbiEi family antitoxin [bacterium]|nr:type IV toxin-antitoxin system AbiEi family antitoxin [bacterium]
MEGAKSSLLAYTDHLLSEGRATFSFEEAKQALQVSDAAVRASLRRLKEKNVLAAPMQKFFVILPPEYRAMGCLPASHFIPNLMKYVAAEYYVCLLSAGEYYGAAHQRPQVFQVMTDTPRRMVKCGRVQVRFISKRDLREVETQEFNTPRGTISVSTPEFTALDLAGYVRQAGGLNNVATVLSELAESLDPIKLVKAARNSPLAWAQRLGYLLEFLSESAKAEKLAKFISDNHAKVAGLSPYERKRGYEVNNRWKIALNTDLEPDI